MELILANPTLTILVVVIILAIGKYVFLPKDSKEQITKDIHNVSDKDNLMLNQLENRLTQNIHALEVRLTKQLGEQAEKMRLIQKETIKESDEKFFTKEMAEKHNERITKMEELMNAFLPKLEKIDIIYDLITKKLGE